MTPQTLKIGKSNYVVLRESDYRKLLAQVLCGLEPDIVSNCG